jgi:NAD(P)-dependent dehydrogenase (short-subunit alcohol dehydrogenase family)
MRLAGRRILVTGGASGIGFAVCELFKAEGAALAVLDADRKRLDEAAGILGGAASVFPCDVADEAQVDEAVARGASAMGGLDGVVNCAGVSQLTPFAELGAAEWRRIHAVNLDGPYNVCRAAVPRLRAAGGGTIVNVASGAGLRPLPGRTAYCSAKAGLVMFSKALAIDLADDNIRVNALCPGLIDTPMARGGLARAADPAAEKAKVLDRYVIKRLGTAEEIAYAALYLTSAESSYTTGSAMAVDGGRTFH